MARRVLKSESNSDVPLKDMIGKVQEEGVLAIVVYIREMKSTFEYNKRD